MLRYLLFTSCMSNCIHCHVRMPRSWAERSPNPQRTHTHSVSFPWGTGTPALIPVYVFTHTTGCAGWGFTRRVRKYKGHKLPLSHTGFVNNHCWDWMASCQWSSCSENHPHSRGQEGYDPLTRLLPHPVGEGLSYRNSPSSQKHSRFIEYCCNNEVSYCT